MRILPPNSLDAFGSYIPRFLTIVGEERWFKRVDQLDREQQRSFFNWKIVSDYHWLEMAIAFQADVLAKEKRLNPEHIDELILAALNFAATTVEVHSALSQKGRRNLEGRLRDGLKAENGYASLYLELNLAQRLMDAGFDVNFTDIERVADFDLLFTRDGFEGEVECKSQSADAGRQIHRKDFYRFMDAIAPELEAQRARAVSEVLLITLDARLPSRLEDQEALRAAVKSMLTEEGPRVFRGETFDLECHSYSDLFQDVPVSDPKIFYRACSELFGQNTHVSGGISEHSGCVVIMRSKKEDDTSKPMLDAMRKAASQFSGKRPSIIAVQEHGISPADLILPHVRRKMGILAYTLYGHYGMGHVNAIYVAGFGAVVIRDGVVATPAFAIPNPNPTFPVAPDSLPTFLKTIPDNEFAQLIGAPPPTTNISNIPLEADGADGTSD